MPKIRKILQIHLCSLDLFLGGVTYGKFVTKVVFVGLIFGNYVTIRRVGRVEAPLELTDSVMRGVVSLPHGFGHGKAGARLGVAARHAGVSANDLTADHLLDAATGNAAFSAVRVEVRALERDRPGGGRP